MRGIALAIIGATMIYASFADANWILTSSESEKETWKAALAVWFIATMIVIAGGW